jgi:hypothetical protein
MMQQIEEQLRRGARRSGHTRQPGIAMAVTKVQKKKRGRTTTAASPANSIPETVLRNVIDMSVTAISSGSVLLCLFAAKRLI